jgi:hypothetical protein
MRDETRRWSAIELERILAARLLLPAILARWQQLVNRRGSSQRREQLFGCSEIGRFKSLAEPGVDRL